MQNIFMRLRLYLLILLPSVLGFSCTKLVSIPSPKNSITTEQLFDSDIQADGALAGIYSIMINGEINNRTRDAALSQWAAGLASLLGAVSADDLYLVFPIGNQDMYEHSSNTLRLQDRGYATALWNSAYKSIYVANSVVEGVAASESEQLSATARQELTAEAKFIRAMAYFYLVNFFGDVPLTLTVNFHETISMKRTPVAEVYARIIEDLEEARLHLREDFSKGNGERIRPNKWAATALLARVYLYTNNYGKAYQLANEVINQTALFGLETDLNQTFVANSREAIWQLQQTSLNSQLGKATPYGVQVSGVAPNNPSYRLLEQLRDAFEPGDKRKIDWATERSISVNGEPGVNMWVLTKYKIGSQNRTVTTPKEYFMVLRLAEMYLVRAEAQAHGAGNGLQGAIEDLNVLRLRAGISELPDDLNPEEVLTAIEKERQVELFGEWAHRWFDLKRTNRATAVLSQVPTKSPWQGDTQLLYPIPVEETRENNNLTQNDGYF